MIFLFFFTCTVCPSQSQGPLGVNWGEDSGSPPIAGEVSELTNSTMVDDVQVSLYFNVLATYD